MEETKEPRPETYLMTKKWGDLFDYGGDDLSNAFMAMIGIALFPWGIVASIIETFTWPIDKFKQCQYDRKYGKPKEDPKT